METLELSENTVNPGQRKVGTYDFELLKVLGKGGYGKVKQLFILRPKKLSLVSDFCLITANYTF